MVQGSEFGVQEKHEDSDQRSEVRKAVGTGHGKLFVLVLAV